MNQAVACGDRSAAYPERVRYVVALAARGAVVLTAAHEGGRFGLTASSVSTVDSAATVLALVDNSSAHVADVARAGTFVVNVLASDHCAVAEEFTAPGDTTVDDVRLDTGSSGTPILRDAVAYLECEVTELLGGLSHSVFAGRVLGVSVRHRDGAQLARPGSERIEFAGQDEVYRQVRDRVLGRVYAPNEVIVLEELAAELGADRSAASYALTRLTSDGCVRRDADQGYVVAEFDVGTSDDMVDAQLSIELGVIELSIGRAAAAEVAELRRHYELMAGALGDGRFVDFRAFFDAAHGFRAQLVALSHNPLLTAAFSDLSTRAQMTRGFGCSPVKARSLLGAFRELTEAFEGADVVRARGAARRHSVITKERMRAILKHTGGRI